MTPPEKLMDRARRLLSSKSYTQAIELCSTVLEQYPDCFDAYFRRAQAYKATGNANAAINDATKALELNPKEPALYFFRGLWRIGAKLYSAGIDDLSEAIRLEAALRSAYYIESARLARAVAYLLTNEWDRAAQDTESIKDECAVFVARRVWTAAAVREAIAEKRI